MHLSPVAAAGRTEPVRAKANGLLVCLCLRCAVAAAVRAGAGGAGPFQTAMWMTAQYNGGCHDHHGDHGIRHSRCKGQFTQFTFTLHYKIKRLH